MLKWELINRNYSASQRTEQAKAIGDGRLKKRKGGGGEKF
jgi:hypothetical protein